MGVGEFVLSRHLPHENSKRPLAPSEGGLLIQHMAVDFDYVSSLQCNRQYPSNSLSLAATSENSYQTLQSSYVQYSTTAIIEHIGTDLHFPCSLTILMNFCFFSNNEYTIIIIFHLFFLPSLKN